jgi:hypothetical protein
VQAVAAVAPRCSVVKPRGQGVHSAPASTVLLTSLYVPFSQGRMALAKPMKA